MSVHHLEKGSPIPAWLCLGDLAIRTARIQTVHVNDGWSLEDKSISLSFQLEGGGSIHWPLPFKSAAQLNLVLNTLDLEYTPTTETVSTRVEP